jgi:hypothetical protein
MKDLSPILSNKLMPLLYMYYVRMVLVMHFEYKICSTASKPLTGQCLCSNKH